MLWTPRSNGNQFASAACLDKATRQIYSWKHGRQELRYRDGKLHPGDCSLGRHDVPWLGRPSCVGRGRTAFRRWVGSAAVPLFLSRSFYYRIWYSQTSR